MKPKELIALFLLMFLTIMLVAAAKARLAKDSDKRLPDARSLFQPTR